MRRHGRSSASLLDYFSGNTRRNLGRTRLGRSRRTWKAFKEPIVKTEIRIAVQSGAVQFYSRVEPASALTLGNGFFQHSGKSISIAQFPMTLGMAGVCLYGCSQQGHGFLHPAGISKHVGHVNASVNGIRLQSNGACESRLRLLIHLVATELKRGASGVRPPEICPGRCVVRSEFKRLLQNSGGQ